MKKIVFIAIILGMSFALQAQKYAFVDTEYILKNIPAFEAANEQLNQTSQGWQKEIEAIYAEVETMYQNYQTESVFLSNEMKIKKEEEIVAKEKEARQLQTKYFGPEGELGKKREALIKPIQDEIYNSIREMVEEDGYAAIFDKASGGVVLFSDSKYDISDDVLEKLGYKK
ncbi:OmpH family outer membrane protein [Saccharicrinis fermentans]|uniref:Periplasmic chaperone n=1 Tax=Saccharicrinis fermentans DSM 9555 = JCM 21142 TaxID=869213 RepID=W7YKW8_9BACT|nr:OmpH family outer membrane protein [Saccharicrinis fermentans]GAF05161.1 periplasmic chaperone [Saccharicrinis fermentans DSM 9555 = JCM 21142]